MRAATLADVAALARLEIAAFTDPWTADQLSEAMGWDGAITLVTESSGAITGYLLGRVVVDQAEILSLATALEHRRQGLAGQMLDEALDTMRTRGVESVWLEVRASNDPAQHLYQSRGFEVAGRRRDYYRQPLEDAIVLRCDLTAHRIKKI